jgi:uncharacterized protein YeaO (DUF488 family)
MIQLKRIYDTPSETDGLRILVDRLWPRGMTKKRAAVDLWLKEVAPSTELRKWFGHDPAKWNQFQEQYRKELRAYKDAIGLLNEKSKEGTVTLLYGARDEEHNEALVLKTLLDHCKKAQRERQEPRPHRIDHGLGRHGTRPTRASMSRTCPRFATGLDRHVTESNLRVEAGSGGRKGAM